MSSSDCEVWKKRGRADASKGDFSPPGDSKHKECYREGYYDKRREMGKDDSSCFPSSSQILTPNGYKRISEFKKGDAVLSFGQSGLLSIQR